MFKTLHAHSRAPSPDARWFFRPTVMSTDDVNSTPARQRTFSVLERCVMNYNADRSRQPRRVVFGADDFYLANIIHTSYNIEWCKEKKWIEKHTRLRKNIGCRFADTYDHT